MTQASAFARVDVIVDGALEESEVFTDEPTLNAWLDELESDAGSHGYETRVYISYHEHSPELECECAQYETDHHPALVFNGEDGETGRWQESSSD